MKITVLLENSTPNDRLHSTHGLSLMVEANGKHVLFDMGPDGSFLENARKMGVNPAQVDFAILSHGHFDHGGGLQAFLEETETSGAAALPATASLEACKAGETAKAPRVYVHERAFEAHRANTPMGLKDIGVNPDLAASFPQRIVACGDATRIDEGFLLFAAVPMTELAPKSNVVLLECTKPENPTDDPADYQPDAFAHEQNLLVVEDGKAVLISGCAHCGIVNIMRKAENLAGGPLHAVVGGFHLMNPASGSVEDPEAVAQIAAFLKSRPTRYYTFHCTGMAAYSLLRDHLGNQINYLYTGSSVEL